MLIIDEPGDPVSRKVVTMVTAGMSVAPWILSSQAQGTLPSAATRCLPQQDTADRTESLWPWVINFTPSLRSPGGGPEQFQRPPPSCWPCG